MRFMISALTAFCLTTLTALGASHAQAVYAPLNDNLRPLSGLDAGDRAGVERPQLALDGTVFLSDLDPGVLTGAQPGDAIGLQLDPETLLVFKTERFDQGVWRGQLDGAPAWMRPATIGVSDTGYFGRFHLPDGRLGELRGRFGEPGLVFVRDESITPPDDPEGGPLVPPSPFDSPVVAPRHNHRHGPSERPGLSGAAASDDVTAPLVFTGDARPVIDILFVYTPQAEAARPTIDFDALFTTLTASLNDALELSGSEAQVRRAGAFSYDYDGPHASFLSDLANGVHPDINEAREAANADLVAYIGIWDFDEARFCGVGWLPANSQYAQSLTHIDCTGGLTFEHEVGHNIGMSHDPDNAGAGFRPYGFGYQNKTEGNRFRTIMAYNCSDGNCPRIPQFSTPDNLYNGEVTGTAETHHNARVATEQASTVASFRDGTSTLSVAVTGAGYVRVDSGEACSTSCDIDLTQSQSVTLTAVPDTAAGASFVDWGGQCSGTDTTCVLPLWQAVSVEANFTDTAQRSLIVEVIGDGSVSSNSGGISCPGTCTALFNTSASVTLTADAPGPNDTRSWTGDCAGSGNSCTVDLSSTQVVQVSYDPILHPVTLTFEGGGGIGNSFNTDRCEFVGAPGCRFEVAQGSSLGLNRTPSPFTGLSAPVNSWSGDCAGTVGEACEIDVTGPVTAGIDLDRTITGFVQTGAPGTVESNPAGLLNPGGNWYTFADGGDEVTVTASGIDGETGFLRWTNYWVNTAYKFENGCPETTEAACTFTVDFSRQLVAVFGYLIETQVAGGGSVTVTGTPDGFTCNAGETCSAPFENGAGVQLVATPADGWRFGGWDGACSGQGATCTLTASSAQSSTAKFLEPNQLFIATAPGARSGVVGGDAITAFVSAVASAGRSVENCTMAAPAGSPATLTYRATDAANVPVGDDNPVFAVDGSTASTFVIALDPTQTTPNEGYIFHPVVECAAEFAAPVVGVNSLALSIGDTAGPDIISIGVTPTADGVVRINGNPGVEAFTAAAVNIGTGDGSGAANEATITVTADTGDAALPLNLTICETDPNTGVCLADQAASVETVFTGDQAKFFTAFVYTDGPEGVTFDPANARVFMRFTDAGGVVRSVTGAAVTAPAAGGDEIAATAAGRYAVQVSGPSSQWPPQQAGTLYVAGNGRGILVSGEDVILADIGLGEIGELGGGLIRAGQRTALAGGFEPGTSITLGYSGQGLSGSIWGVYDARSRDGADLSQMAGYYAGAGGTLSVSNDGLISGMLGSCEVSGVQLVAGDAPGLKAFDVELSQCSQAGLYLGVLDQARTGPTLILAGEHASWQLSRTGALALSDPASAQ